MLINAHNLPPAAVYSRIVSLVPSQTELLYDLGLEEEVIAITKFCVHPWNWFRNKPRIGGTKNIKIPAIRRLRPDLIIANKEENVKEQVEELAADYDVFVTDVKTFADAMHMICDIGLLVGKREVAIQMANRIESAFMKLRDLSSGKRKIRAAYLIWKNPFITVGGDTFINDIMPYCNLENVFSSVQRYPEITIEQLQNNCELILLSSEPYPFKEQHVNQMASLIPGVKIVLVDGEMFSWYGSRLLKASTYLEVLQLQLTG